VLTLVKSHDCCPLIVLHACVPLPTHKHGLCHLDHFQHKATPGTRTIDDFISASKLHTWRKKHSFYFALLDILASNNIWSTQIECNLSGHHLFHGPLVDISPSTYIYICWCWMLKETHTHYILAWIIDSEGTVIYVPAGVALKQKQKKSVLKIKIMIHLKIKISRTWKVGCREVKNYEINVIFRWRAIWVWQGWRQSRQCKKDYFIESVDEDEDGRDGDSTTWCFFFFYLFIFYCDVI
jgi:hypothetical protein